MDAVESLSLPLSKLQQSALVSFNELHRHKCSLSGAATDVMILDNFCAALYRSTAFIINAIMMDFLAADQANSRLDKFLTETDIT